MGSLLNCQSRGVLRALYALLFYIKMQAGRFAEYLWHFMWEDERDIEGGNEIAGRGEGVDEPA